MFFSNASLEVALERCLEKAGEITFADRPGQRKRDLVRSIRHKVEQIANIVYAGKHKWQNTLTNQSHADRR